MNARFPITLVLVLVVTLTVACKLGRDKSNDPEPVRDVLESGESLGEIERLPGGTAVASDVRTLIAAHCAGGVLTLRTNQEEITAAMDCAAMVPEPVVVPFIGQPVAIRAQDGRLVVENETAGTLNFPASDPRITETANAP